jgi:type VI secretion system protein ImpM
MPSVDRVGRSFPLTLAVALASYGEVAHAVFCGGEWFARMEEAALSVLDVTRGPEDLDQLLVDRPFIAPAPASPSGTVGTIGVLPSVEGFEAMAQGEALRVWGEHGGWKALWWTRGRIDEPPLVLASAGLPSVDEFAGLLQSHPSPIPAEADADAAAPSSFIEP